MITLKKRLLLTITLFFNVLMLQNVASATSPYPQSNEIQQSIFDVLSHTEVLDITIETDLTNLIENRRTEDFQKAILTYQDARGIEVIRDMKVQPRGKFRRRICDFPPVKIKFKKDDLEESGLFREYNDLKLVTHCMDDKADGNENLLREYLVYKMYQELSPNSYRVQLVKITYVDSEGNMSKVKRYGFLIEDTDEMAARIGGVEYEQMNVSHDSIIKQDESTMALFEYMIGNADWNTTMLRNVKMVQSTTTGMMTPVPYDFDFSGLVNTSYAIPSSDNGLYSIRDRLYMGFEFDKTTMRSVIAHFLSKKENILNLVTDFKLLSVVARHDMVEYLETFYSAIEPVHADKDVDLVAFFELKNASLEQLHQQQLNAEIERLSNPQKTSGTGINGKKK